MEPQYNAEIIEKVYDRSARIETDCNSIAFISLVETPTQPSYVGEFPLAYRQSYGINFDSNTRLKTILNLRINGDRVLVIKSYCKQA